MEFVPFAPTDEDIIYPDLGIIQVLTTVKILVTILKIHVIKMLSYITLMDNDELLNFIHRTEHAYSSGVDKQCEAFPDKRLLLVSGETTNFTDFNLT